MTGFTSDIINLITNNLQDRYHGGFPILKELIQNADDSKASRFIFGIHKGFEGRSIHALLQGAGIWCFNNGQFKVTDKRAIRSFAENAKAGESDTIGKFGLGMKSVFHLCEAFFYVAFDGKEIYWEFLNPWDNRDSEVTHIHADWDAVDSDDWRLLQQEFADYLDAAEQWFLLWIPLRQKRHIQSPNGEEYGSIIADFPGDDLGKSLDFLKDDDLAIKLGGLLPLLSKLREIQFVPMSDETMWKTTGFSIQLDADKQMILTEEDSTQNNVSAQGYIVIRSNQTDKKLPFNGNKYQSIDPLFQALKQKEKWPKTRYRDAQGKQADAPDKSRAEGAVLISHQEGTQGKLTLQWAVFLPLEEKTHIVSVDIEGGYRHYHFVLHGQFFIDAGRRGIHEFQQLHNKFKESNGQLDEHALRTTWNQALAQNATLPLILQTLHEYVGSQKLTDKEINGLTTALRQGLKQFLDYVCRDHVWFRKLSQTGGRWQLHKKTDSPRILPLPAPPQDAPKRPWEVLPRLQTLTDTLFNDNDSADISNDSSQWTAETIRQVLQEPTSSLFADAGQLDYFNKFLEVINPILGHGDVQQALMTFIHQSIVNHGQQRLRNNQQKVSRVISHLDADKRWKFGTVDAKAQSNISDEVIKALWQCKTAIFPVPAFLDADNSAKGKLNTESSEMWLEVLQKLQSESALILIKSILKELEPKNDRSGLIKSRQDWQLVSAYDAKLDKNRTVSYRELLSSKEDSLLFAFAGKNTHGKIKLLTNCLMEALVLAVDSDYNEILFDKKLSTESDDESILTSLLNSNNKLLSNIEPRKNLLKEIKISEKFNENTKKSLRYLLHANHGNKNSNDVLWINAHEQSPAWEKLQRKLIGDNHWQVINSELANMLPRNSWEMLGIKEIKPDQILEELKKQPSYTLFQADDFSADECIEILNKIDDKDLWCRLPWHKTIDGRWVSIENNTYLKSIELPDTLKREINIIEPVSELAEKQRWIQKLDAAAAISITLNSTEPSEHHEKILAWLEKVDVKSDLEEKLKSIKWLLLKNNRPISPNDIIAIERLNDAIQKLAVSADYAYASDKDLHDSIIQHSVFDKKVKSLFATESKDILEKLALLMNEVPAYALGFLCESDDINKLAKALADCELAPNWGIIKAIVNEFMLADCKRHLLSNLNGLPEKPALINILDWLQKKSTQQAQAAYVFYLRQIVLAGHVEELLPQIKLLAKDGKSWRLASELCINAPGVDNAFVLCDEQRDILIEYLQSGTVESTQSNSSARHIVINDYLKNLEGRVKLPLLGLLAALLKVDSKLVKSYLSPNSVDTIYKILSWQTPDMQGFNANARQVIKEKWNSTEFALTCGFNFDFVEDRSQENETATANLLGKNKPFLLSKTIDKLIIKRSTFIFDQISSQVKTMLYLWDADELENNDESLLLTIKNTCEWLWTELYCQHSQSLHQLWEKLAETHQLDIAVTRSVILKHAAFYLNTLGINKESKLKKVLSYIKNAETRLAEAENNEDKDTQVEWQKNAKNYQQSLIETLQNDVAAQHILEKVQSKLKEFQYESDSILFELFQNADDAVLQLARCESYPDKTIKLVEQCQQFRIIVHDNTVYAMHWGRAINDRCSTEAQEKWPGYGEDLEKMLILSASDKPDDKAVTGRFGLGFKSVFLACDSPKIISGDLKVNIIAGFLPEVWKEAEETQSLLRRYTKNPRYPGTLVALPLRQTIHPDTLLYRFKQQQAFLCMTSKTLRAIGVNEDEFTWSPKCLCSNKKLEFGLLQGKHYLVYRDEIEEGFAAVVMRVSARGFELLKAENDKDKTPSFWVVAPTRETASVGFVMSAPFQIDAGRGKLAGEGYHDKQNQKLVEQLGDKMGYALAQLYPADWEELRPQLGLADDVSKAEWWTSLWKQFSDNYEWNKDDAPFHLAKAFVESLLTSWSENTKLIPNGLPQKQAGLVQADSVSHSIPKNWYLANALQHLSGWEAFDKAYPSNQIIADWVMQIWRKLKLDSRTAELGLGNLIDLIEDKKCGVELADKLGCFLISAYKADEQKFNDEKKQIELDTIKFLSKQDTYQSSNKLLSVHEADKEEKLRVAFAPDEHILSDKYTESGRKFFRDCRKQMGCADELEKWFINASEQKREAALLYIVKSNDGSKLADKVRNCKSGKWFDKASLESLIKTWDDDDKKIIRHRLQSDDDVSPQATCFPPIPEPLKQRASLAQIYQWWERDGDFYRKQYLSQLYPRGEIPNLTIHENGDYNRQGWMLLLGIGVFQRLGRVRDFGTRGFIEYLQRQGWWDTFCTNPKENGEGWLNVLYEYSEHQNYDEEYSYWMTMLPNLFKIALKLDDYVILFEGIQHRQQHQITNVLMPNLDLLLQGAGFESISPINRTLRKGFNLVVRELLRAKIIDNPEAHTYAYMPAPRVQRVLDQLSDYGNSISIYQSLCNAIGEEKAIFDGDFDIPLLVLASNKNLLKTIAGIELEEEESESWD